MTTPTSSIRAPLTYFQATCLESSSLIGSFHRCCAIRYVISATNELLVAVDKPNASIPYSLFLKGADRDRALKLALSDKKLDTARRLMALGANPLQMDSAQNTLWHYFAAEGNVEALDFLNNYAASGLNTSNKQLETPLMKAVIDGKLEAVRTLLNFRAVASSNNSNGMTAFTLSTKHPEISMLLMQNKGHFVPTSPAKKIEVFWNACHAGNIPMLQICQSDLTLRNNNLSGQSGLHCAIGNNQQEAVEFLVQLPNINLEYRDCHLGLTPLETAVFKNRPGILEFLLSSTTIGCKGSIDKNLLLEHALEKGYTEVASILTRNPHFLKNSHGSLNLRVLRLAVRMGHKPTIEAFLRQGFNIESEINSVTRHNLIMYAIFYNESLVDWLIAKGASLTNGNPTPLEVAAEHGKASFLRKVLISEHVETVGLSSHSIALKYGSLIFHALKGAIENKTNKTPEEWMATINALLEVQESSTSVEVPKIEFSELFSFAKELNHFNDSTSEENLDRVAQYIRTIIPANYLTI